MSAESTQAWDPRIRPWVRHPNVDAPSESVCYQLFPAGTVALAWRYRDRQAAEREDGAHGRPLVSRVLVGQAGLLTPDVAIALCRAGLPAAAGPRPGQVGPETVLSPISADELTGLVRERAAALDQHAAREKGLQQVVAAALSDPDTPLAIQLRDPYIFATPPDGSQSLLLWGLWRTVWPLLGHGIARRGWSFSTFELPMGDMDTSTLPDIVFRRAQAAPTVPPASARRENRVRPGDPSASAARGPYAAELAEWLVSEYQETNGDELRQLIAECSAGHPLESRLKTVYDVLRARRSPVSMSSPVTPFVSVSPAQEPAPVPTADEPAVAENPTTTASSQVAAFHPATTEPPAPQYADTPEYRDTPDYWDAPRLNTPDPGASEYTDGPGRPVQFLAPMFRLPSRPEPTIDPDNYLTGRPEEAPRLATYENQQAVRNEGAQPHSVRSLLMGLDSETDIQDFQSILQRILGSTAEFDERDEVRRQMPKIGWYIPAFERHGYKYCVDDLAGLFRILVIPDLERARVAAELRDWVRQGPPQVTAALLAAAKAVDEARHSGYEMFQLMTEALGEAGLQKLLEASGIPFEWPHLPRRRDTRTGNHRSDGGFFARLFAFLGLGRD
jgi:hypothetical protein